MDLTPIVEQFHWLRPLWLLGLLPALLIFLSLWRLRARPRDWQALIDHQLLPYLADGRRGNRRRWPLWFLLVAWTLACLALAGPTWEKRPMPVHQSEQAMVLLLDLSPSMQVEDISPSRLLRARLKLTDVLRQRREGQTALIAYGGDAHVVSPLTDDSDTVINLLGVLEPDIMPLPGSAADRAVEKALELFHNAGVTQGDILLVTDGMSNSARQQIEYLLSDSNVRLSILGVGTSEGAPVPGDQGFERDDRGQVIIARLRGDRLENLARQTHGRYHRITPDGSDLDWLLSLPPGAGDRRTREIERDFDQWYDQGHWLVLLLLPVLLYCFRRGTLLALLFAPLLLLSYSTPGQASPWLTPDQQGQRYLERGDPDAAAELFDHPEWRGTALYRAGDYEGAAQSFAQLDSARAHYNRGNALTHLGELEAALDAYDQALEKDPNHRDAATNRRLVEQLLEQQEQQEQQDGEGDPEQTPDDGEQQENDERQDSSQQQESDQQQEGDGQQESGEQEHNGEQQPGDEQPDPESDSDDRRDGRDQESDDPTQEEQSDDARAEEDTADTEAAEAEQPQPETNEQNGDPQGELPLGAEDFSDEELQELQQWLRRIPDDPGGLLRRKFRYEQQQRASERRRDQWQEQHTE